VLSRINPWIAAGIAATSSRPGAGAPTTTVTGLFDAIVSAPQNPVSQGIETDTGGDSFEWGSKKPGDPP